MARIIFTTEDTKKHEELKKLDTDLHGLTLFVSHSITKGTRRVLLRRI
jgi:hypothetical protein